MLPISKSSDSSQIFCWLLLFRYSPLGLRRGDRTYGKVDAVGQNVDVDAGEYPVEARLRYVM